MRPYLYARLTSERPSRSGRPNIETLPWDPAKAAARTARRASFGFVPTFPASTCTLASIFEENRMGFTQCNRVLQIV